jgi:diguanylate cyclase (GGDEF)-like protein
MTGSATARDFSRYLDAVVELTRQRDSQELLAALLRTLGTTIQAGRAQLYALSNPDHDTDFDAGNIQHAVVNDLFDSEFGDPRPLGSDPDLLACVCSGEILSRDTPTGRRLVFPVSGKRNVRALLVIEESGDEALPRELLAKLLQVYSNQTLTLARSELDPLTGLYNRQTFDDRMRRVALSTARQRRVADGPAGAGVCFALFDIDHFKRVNDQYGHLYGDEVLALFSRLMLQSFRHEDMLFRYGGEEFAVVLSNADLKIALAALERFRRKVEQFAFPQIGQKTVSIGFTSFSAELGVEKIMMCADKALYFAKNDGRNRTCCYETLVAERKIEPVTQPKGEIELF